jgi:hypothetical protein
MMRNRRTGLFAVAILACGVLIGWAASQAKFENADALADRGTEASGKDAVSIATEAYIYG